MRVIVVGGGVMGCATALECALRGVSEIVVLERAVPGAEASSAAAGLLAAQIEAGDDHLEEYVYARNEYAAWANALHEATGINIGYRKTGALAVARRESQHLRLRAVVELQKTRGLAASFLDGPEARRVEPTLAHEVEAAAWFPEEAQVDPPQLLRALVAAIAQRGVEIRKGKTVTSLVVHAGRCTDVALDDGDVLLADGVVLAAGSWSSLVPGIPSQLPRVRPIRGHIVLLEQSPPQLRTLVFEEHAYVVPRGDGRVLCGSTTEDVGHRRLVTAGAVRSILEAAIAMSPVLAEAEMVRAWCNFRPLSETGAPLVGLSSVEGLFLATGHHRNGILLAQQASRAVADAMVR